MRILLIDDNDDVRSCLQSVLQQLDYECTASPGGEEVFALLANNCYDLVLTDVDMPYLSGTEIAAHCALHYPSLPIIVMSGSSAPDLPPDTPFLGKPFSLTDLVNTVTRLTQYTE
ncbi:MAG: CheY-like chemotaxis protein [Candidatus Latescibacterota bacterium]|jgi:CheY-like chemotaxis protein